MTKIKDFSKIRETFALPNMLDIQTKSYEDFLQTDAKVEDRKDQGLQEVFQEIFPLESYDRQTRLEFISYGLGKPKYNYLECQRRGMTFAAPLKVKLRLISPQEIKEQEVYLGELP
jgi:DNA-directed RNA polymerase, beta subunit/140 kD subunit